MSDEILGGWGVKWIRMWTREWIDPSTGLRSPAARIWRSWYYGRWASTWSPGRGGPGQKREQFYLFVVTAPDGTIVDQGCVHGRDGLSRARGIVDRVLTSSTKDLGAG